MEVECIKTIASDIAKIWVSGKQEAALAEYKNLALSMNAYYAVGCLIQLYINCITGIVSRQEAVSEQKRIFKEAEEFENE